MGLWGPMGLGLPQGISRAGTTQEDSARGGEPDLDDSDAHTHAQDDAQVVLQPRLHLLHAALQERAPPVNTQNHQEGPSPEGSVCSWNRCIKQYVRRYK